jgi:predicted SpoU family rRNA methylase
MQRVAIQIQHASPRTDDDADRDHTYYVPIAVAARALRIDGLSLVYESKRRQSNAVDMMLKCWDCSFQKKMCWDWSSKVTPRGPPMSWFFFFFEINRLLFSLI